MPGTLFLVVGPSGAGKDTLIDGARTVLAGMDADGAGVVFARRAITRPADAGGEDHEEIDDAAFDARRDSGGFMLHWEAHGLKYGVPASYADALAAGANVVANVSRGVIGEAIARFAPAVVLEITASPDILAARLAGRGRETAAEVAARLARDAARIPSNADIVTIVNDGPREDGIARVVSLLRNGRPASAASMQRKIDRAALDYRGYCDVIGDIVAGHYAEAEIADFLTATAETLTDDETVDLARARLDFAHRMTWDADIVADKHSMGGIPGSRISMVVIPIVAAYGLTIPKTSSRAITSPAGTADAMEVLARVDLDTDDVRRVVKETGGCIAWNGGLNHSRVDDVMNAITRPLRIDSLKWSVASILSKKIAAGATHCIIDIPLGPTAKVRTAQDAQRLRNLFLHVGGALGLGLEVRLTDGSAPVGRGIGPALEARDVVAVLRGDADAPQDLRVKALDFAAAALCFDPAMSRAEAPVKARELLDSGAAHEALQRMIAAQGPPPEEVLVGQYTVEIAAPRAGAVDTIDCFALAGIARAAGAPVDKGAGLDLFVRPGAIVAEGEPLYRLHARTGKGLDAARKRAAENTAFTIC